MVPLPPPRNKEELIQQIEYLEKSIKKKAMMLGFVYLTIFVGVYYMFIMILMRL